MILTNKEPSLVQIDGFNVTGLSIQTINQDEFNSPNAKMPDLWQRFFSEDVADNVPYSTLNSPILCVYSNYASDASGLYTVTAGMKVSRPSPTLEFSTVYVLPGPYLVFENKGVMPQAVIETWERVWAYFASRTRFTRCFKTDFEMYQSGGDVAIYIGVESSD